jgi:hypothetical protein
MILEREKLAKAKEIVQKMAGGINPLNGAQIENDNVLNDPKMVRCLYFIQDVLEMAIDGRLRTSADAPADFVVTPSEIDRIQLPPGKIGVNEFAKCVNKVIDLNRSKKLTGMEINRRLKKMGALGEKVLDDGKKRTAMNERSHDFGIESEKRNFNGNDYEMILFNARGKKFLLDNLEKILECAAAPGNDSP